MSCNFYSSSGILIRGSGDSNGSSCIVSPDDQKARHFEIFVRIFHERKNFITLVTYDRKLCTLLTQVAHTQPTHVAHQLAKFIDHDIFNQI